MIRFSRALLLAALLLPLPGAARAADNEYTPSEQTLAGISVEQAHKILNDILPHWYMGLEGNTFPISGFKIGPTRIDITVSDPLGLGRGSAASLMLDNASIVVVFSFLSDRIEVNGVGLSPPIADKQETMAVTNALYVLRKAAHQAVSPEGDPAFAAVVSAYRQAQPKPQLPEDARRFEVQAKGAIQDGDFADAATYYGQALQVAPWWPGGHFNRAAVLAELGEYPLAIGEMQRYLLLAPDAPDARASQDKIYNWERLNQKAAAAAPMPAKPAPEK